MFRTTVFLTGLVLLLGVAGEGTAKNIALGKKYRFARLPVYSYSSGPEDATDLTDGKRVKAAQVWNKEGKNLPWTKQGMVGWTQTRQWQTVEIDLEKLSAIDTIIVSTYYGYGSGCFLPKEVKISVSDKGKVYHRLASLEPKVEQTGMGQYSFEAKNLKTGGRYVLVEMLANGKFLFCDEIMVLAGKHSRGWVKFAPGTEFVLETRLYALDQFPFPELKGKARLKRIREATALQEALTRLVDRVAKYHGNDPELAARLARLRAKAEEKLDLNQYKGAFDQVLAISSSGKQRRFSPAKAHLWWTNSWKPITPIDEPTDITIKELTNSLTLAANEVAPAALMVTNATNKEISLGINLSGDFNREGVKVRLAYFHLHNDKRPDQISSNPLPLLAAMKDPVKIPPGQTRQVWFECQGSKLGPGKHLAKIEVTDAEGVIGQARLDITVSDMVLPLCSVKSQSYDYLTTRTRVMVKGKGYEKWVINDLADHGITHFVMSNRSLPRGEFDKNGRLKKPLDFTALDRELEIRGKDMGLNFFFYQGPDRFLRPGFEWQSKPWKRALRTWITSLSEHLEKRGWTPEKVFMYPYDEVGPTSARYLGEVVQYVNSFDPEIAFFATAFGAILGTPGEEAILKTIKFPISWCLAVSCLDRVKMFTSAAKRPWTYAVLNQNDDPYQDARLLWWKAVKHQLAGVAFWAYASTQKELEHSAWYGYSTYTMVYDRKTAPFSTTEELLTSKKWEGWRQGWTDIRYMDLARALAAKAERTTALQREIDKLVEWVLAEPKDYTRADQARRKLQALVSSLSD